MTNKQSQEIEGSVADFLGRDGTHQPDTCHRLYGRETSISQILSAFESVSRGQGETVLLPGPSGIGKTSLARLTCEPVRASNGFFLEGKFNQYSQNVPFAAFRQALSQFCQLLVNEDVIHREQWKLRILEAVGHFAQLLIDLEPAFETVIGPQAPLAPISPNEARHRFARVIRSLFEVICRPEHPVVLFLDDWQWADSASLELLTQLHSQTPLRYLLIIAAYRDDEVDGVHPFSTTLAELRLQEVPITCLELSTLAAESLTSLLRDKLKGEINQPAELIEFILRRTSGNPFFTNVFIDFLLQTKRLRLDEQNQCWQLETKDTEQNHPSDVVTWYAWRLGSLDVESRELISLAACLGHRFELESLAIISRKSVDSCRALLLADSCSPFVVVSHDVPTTTPIQANRSQNRWRFLHDRIQQAAYALIGPEKQVFVRHKMAMLLLDQLGKQELFERLFEVVENLNFAASLVTELPEAIQTLELNLLAARKARAASAYRAELQFLQCAKRFLDDTRFADELWKVKSESAIRLLKELAESEFMEGNRDAAFLCVREAVGRLASPVEKAETLTISIVHYTLLAKYPEAIATGREALEILGIKLPEKEFEAARDLELAQVRISANGRSSDELFRLPLMTNPHWVTASRILIAMGPPCYRSDQALWSVIVPKVVRITLNHGHIPQIGYSHTAIGGLLNWVANDYVAAKEFSELATRLMSETFTSSSDNTVFQLMIGSSVRHWFQHLKHSSEAYDLAYQIGLDSGNLQYAAYAFGHNMYCRFYQGANLATLTHETKNSLAFSRTRHNQWAMDLLEGGLRIFDTMSAKDSPASENDSSDEEFCERVEANHNRQVICIYKVIQSFCHLVMREHEAALEVSEAAHSSIHMVGTQGLLPWPEHVMTRFLIRTSLFATVDTSTQVRWRAEFEKTLEQLKVWSTHSPENFEHKTILAKAELARLDGRTLAAANLYDLSIKAARQSGFVQWEAFTNELAAKNWADAKSPWLEQTYWQQAYEAYSRWGAIAKVRLMEHELKAKLSQALQAFEPEAIDLEQAVDGLNANVVNQQIEHLHQVCRRQAEADDERDARQHSEELALATERLRIEVADRKKAEATTRLQNDLLEERVIQRTRELQTSRDELEILAERFELATRAKDMGIWDWDIKNDQILCNELLCSIYGMSEKDFEGSFESWLDCIHPMDQTKVRQAVNRSLAENVPFNEEFRVWRSDGKIRTIKAERQVIRDAANVPVRMIGVSYDITENKRHSVVQSLRQEVAERVARGKELDEVLMFLACAIEELDLGTACAFLVRHSTDKSIYRISSPKVPFTDTHILDSAGGSTFDPFDNACHAPHILELKNTADSKQSPISFPSNEHAGIRYRWSLPILSSSRLLLGWLEIYSDRSVPTHSEELTFAASLAEVGAIALEHTAYIQELEKARESAQVANQTKSEFLANMSHEIRTPMTAILGYTDILNERCNLDTFETEVVETIRRNGHHLLEIINDILDLSKIESGKLEMERIRFSPMQCLKDVLSLVKTRADGKGLRLEAEFRGLLPSQIESDPTRLRQILFNLIGNAIKFTEMGSVRIVTELLPKPGNQSSLRFSVIDTGIGIAPESMHRLFQPFAQADSSTTRQFGGTGLGLTICKRLASLLGGDVAVSSTIGTGSCFQLTIDDVHLEGVPMIDASAPESIPLAPVSKIQKPSEQLLLDRRILLAEDGPDNQRLIAFMLRKAGADVVIVENGLAAMETILASESTPAPLGDERDQRFNVVLMDMQMPVMDGYDATRRLRECGYGGVIIALTAHAMASDRTKCLDVGCTDYLTKPVDRQGLITVVASHCSNPNSSILESVPLASDGSSSLNSSL